MKNKKTIIIIILILGILFMKGCVLGNNGILFEIENWRGYDVNDFIKNENLEDYRFNEILLRPIIIPAGKGNYQVSIIGYSKEYGKKLTIEELIIKNNKGEELLYGSNLDANISTGRKFETAYTDRAYVGEILEDRIESGMKLFLTVNVKNDMGELKQILYVIDANSYWYSKISI